MPLYSADYVHSYTRHLETHQTASIEHTSGSGQEIVAHIFVKFRILKSLHRGLGVEPAQDRFLKEARGFIALAWLR